jgi:hypothetical protein
MAVPDHAQDETRRPGLIQEGRRVIAAPRKAAIKKLKKRT